MTPFYVAIDHDFADIYICLFANRDNAITYCNADIDNTETETNKEQKIDGVYDTDSCNEYLQAHNGYIAEIFEGHSLY